MKLRDFLKLVPSDEIISLYVPSKNIYLQFEISKENYDKDFENYTVVGVSTNLTNGYCSVLEISAEAD